MTLPPVPAVVSANVADPAAAAVAAAASDAAADAAARADAAAHGLYRAEHEHDACGVGFVAHI